MGSTSRLIEGLLEMAVWEVAVESVSEETVIKRLLKCCIFNELKNIWQSWLYFFEKIYLEHSERMWTRMS